MTRTRKSAKAAGSKWEREVAEYLDKRLPTNVERRVKTGAKDRGDIGGVFFGGQRVVLEAKDYSKGYHVSEWLAEAAEERDNDGAAIGVVVAKRRGKSDPGLGVVMMTVEDLVWLLEMGQ